MMRPLWRWVAAIATVGNSEKADIGVSVDFFGSWQAKLLWMAGLASSVKKIGRLGQVLPT